MDGRRLIGGQVFESIEMDFTNIHVLVTGASGSIGSVTASHFLDAGAKLSALDLNMERWTLTHPNLYKIEADICDESSMEKAFQQARIQFGPVQVCIALASINYSDLKHVSLADMDVEQIRKTLKVNVEGTFITCGTFLRQLRETKVQKNVAIVIMGSESGIAGNRMNADYAAGKSAVQVGLLKSLKNDIVRICPTARCNAIAPGQVDTPAWRETIRENPELLYLDVQATSTLKRAVPMAQVAKTILFLTSEEYSGLITGQVVSVNGGKEGAVVWEQSEV